MTRIRCSSLSLTNIVAVRCFSHLHIIKKKLQIKYCTVLDSLQLMLHSCFGLERDNTFSHDEFIVTLLTYQ